MNKRRKLRRTDQLFKSFRNNLFLLYKSSAEEGLIKMNHLSTDLWSHLFKWYFTDEFDNTGEPTIDDSRWDLLLHEIGGMQADNRVRKIILRQKNRTIQKAA